MTPGRQQAAREKPYCDITNVSAVVDTVEEIDIDTLQKSLPVKSISIIDVDDNPSPCTAIYPLTLYSFRA